VLRWIIASALAAAAVNVAVPSGRRRAFKRGWFERRTQTRRSTRQRRPTHGGLVLAVCVAIGGLATGVSQPGGRAAVAIAVVATLLGWRAERGRPGLLPSWVEPLAVGAILPVAGLRAELTGSTAMDAVATLLVAAAATVGLRSIERSDGTAPLLVGAASVGFLFVAVVAEHPIAPLAGALGASTVAIVGLALPPATVRLGKIGPLALGPALASVAVGIEPEIAAPASVLVPILMTLPLGAALVLPGWDSRLRRRRLSPPITLGTVAIASAVAGERLAADALSTPAAVLLAAVPTGFVALVGFVTAAPRRGERSRRRAAAGMAAAGMALVAIAVAGVAAVLLFSAREDMLDGREAATAGLTAAQDGDLEESQRHFEKADAAFSDAASALGNPAVRLGELVPGIGANLRNVRTLADVGKDLSTTAVAVAERAGADDLVVVDGQFPIEGARRVSRELAPALETLRDASRRLEASDSALLVPEVQRGSDDVAERILDATNSIEVAAEATRLAPGLLGADGDTRWMVAILTPSEQRGAGGLAGDYAELRASDGDIELVRTLPASELNDGTDPAAQIAALPQIYRDRYDGFRVDRFWQNLSATPDIPTFAAGIAAAFPLTDTGGSVDGVITVDPHAIAALLKVTGPVRVPDWPVPITQKNAVRVLLFEHYDRLTQEQIDRFQGDVVEAVVDELTSGELPAPSRLAAALAPAVAGGHLRLWSPEAAPQALFERIGADGTLGDRPRGADFVELVTQSASESKIDWYLRRELRYEPAVDPATGELQATATVTLTNTAPTSGVSTYILGEDEGPTDVGENELRLTLFTPHQLREVTEGGSGVGANVGRERGLNGVTVVVELDPGESRTLVFTFGGELPASPGRYALRVGRQPAVTPDLVEVALSGLHGWRPAGRSGGRATLDKDGDVRFSASLSGG
jgi:UDP-N-acetylmuramyl pentapeptide phosphotransferase/UDP-N-acetylglucosamine-1-phosphate transferase